MTKLQESLVIAFVLTAVSYIVGLSSGWIDAIPWLEVFAVFTSYSCTYLCVKQSRLNYPIGIITTAAYSVLFYQWEMLGLAVFNLYLVLSLTYGWFRWGSDDSTRPVTTVQPIWYVAYSAFGVAILAAFLIANHLFNPTGVTELNPIDVALAVMSGVAQLMLDNKKIETWMVWTAVNIVSIPFFWSQGLTIVAFQYIFFLGNAVYGWIEWKRSMPVEDRRRAIAIGSGAL